ncbi:MAG: cation diffusion facilitator family transporter [Thermodesulfobacteriota bacterium]
MSSESGPVHHHDHPHHDHSQGGDPGRRLALSLAVTLLFMAGEAVGGWLTNSLALLSDAGHMLTDAAALGLSLFALRVGARPPSVTKTFGYRRFEILAALANGLALWGIVGIILHEAFQRLSAPPAVKPLGMMLVAALGLAVNLISIRLLHGHRHESLNIRGAFLHVVADGLGSLAALSAALVIWAWGWTLADPLASFGICLLILASSWGLVREAVHMLLLGVPGHLSYRDVEAAILGHPGVCCVYDLHIWSIASGHEAVSAHVVTVAEAPSQPQLLQALVLELRERFGIRHVTIQLESSHDLRDTELGPSCRVGGDDRCCCRPTAAATAASRK